MFGLALSGCFNPQVKTGGFACSASDPDPCPAGFYCVQGLCLDRPGAGGSGGVGGTAGHDLSVAVADMATAHHRDLSSGAASDLTQLVDMTPPPPDLLMCGASGGFCLLNSDCCSNKCAFITGCK